MNTCREWAHRAGLSRFHFHSSQRSPPSFFCSFNGQTGHRLQPPLPFLTPPPPLVSPPLHPPPPPIPTCRPRPLRLRAAAPRRRSRPPTSFPRRSGGRCSRGPPPSPTPPPSPLLPCPSSSPRSTSPQQPPPPSPAMCSHPQP